MTKEQILTEAMALDPADRHEVAEALRQSVIPHELTSQQIEELRRRVDARDAGTIQLIPGEQVMEELRRRFER